MGGVGCRLRQGRQLQVRPNIIRNLGKLWEDWAWDRRIWAEILWAWDSTCVAPNGSAYSDMADYHRMWEGIQASGRSMILTVEGSLELLQLRNGEFDAGPSLHWRSSFELNHSVAQPLECP